MASIMGVSAILAAAFAIGATPPPANPIRLEVQDLGGSVRLQVIGDAAEAVEARYTLSVETGSGSSNRSAQSGVARVVPGKPATYITLNVSTGQSGAWKATLLVEPTTGAAYTIARTSSES